MSARKIRFAFAPVVWALALMGGLLFFSGPVSRSGAGDARGIYFLPSAGYLRMVTGSFRPFFANLVCIKGVLELTDPVPDRQTYLLKVFKTAIELDPRLLSAYFLGGMVVPVNSKDMPGAINFLEEVRELNPRAWQIPYWIGFNYLQIGQHEKAAQYYQKAAALPGAPQYLVTNQAMLYYRANKPEGALMYLEGLLDSIKDPRSLELIKRKITWLKDLITLDAKTREFKARFGSWPDALDDLVNRGLIAEIPQDPFGHGYFLDKRGAEADIRVRSKFE
ncbi:MAG TPA: tetratricopeptide repeat protein [Candidatus Omnitrophota bacterium]|nr:tetratricopeptide repeat protein [Candidatus Omnitrophota bacterium]